MLAELSVLRFRSVVRRDQCRLSADEQPNGEGSWRKNALPRCFDSTLGLVDRPVELARRAAADLSDMFATRRSDPARPLGACLVVDAGDRQRLVARHSAHIIVTGAAVLQQPRTTLMNLRLTRMIGTLF